MNKYSVFFEDYNWDYEYINCPKCENSKLTIVNGDKLPFQVQLRCLECNHHFNAQSPSKDVWIKFDELS